MENIKNSLRATIKEAFDLKIDILKDYYARRISPIEFEKAFSLSFKSTMSNFYISLKSKADDSMRLIKIDDPDNPTDIEIETILNAFNEEYKGHIVGFRNEIKIYSWLNNIPYYAGTFPIFESPYEETFYKEMNDYIDRKALWIERPVD